MKLSQLKDEAEVDNNNLKNEVRDQIIIFKLHPQIPNKFLINESAS